MSKQITAFPLCWPAGWKREPDPTGARFRTTEIKTSAVSFPGQEPHRYRRGKALSVYDATIRVLAVLRRMGVGDWNVIVSTNIQVKANGLPYSSQKEPLDTGAAVYWTTPKEEKRCIAIDRYNRVADNLAAIAATLEAMRAIERHGGAQILDRVFMGFTALPPPGPTWRQVLNLTDGDTKLADAEYAYRNLARQYHPDSEGGSDKKMAELNHAISEARKELTV